MHTVNSSLYQGNYSGLVLKYVSGGQLHAVQKWGLREWHVWRKRKGQLLQGVAWNVCMNGKQDLRRAPNVCGYMNKMLFLQLFLLIMYGSSVSWKAQNNICTKWSQKHGMLFAQSNHKSTNTFSSTQKNRKSTKMLFAQNHRKSTKILLPQINHKSTKSYLHKLITKAQKCFFLHKIITKARNVICTN